MNNDLLETGRMIIEDLNCACKTLACTIKEFGNLQVRENILGEKNTLDVRQRNRSYHLRQALQEPFIAYLKVTEDSQEKVIYICRFDAIDSGENQSKKQVIFVSRNAKLGRLASLMPLEEFSGYQIIEKWFFVPEVQHFDLINNHFWGNKNNHLVFQSMKALLISPGLIANIREEFLKPVLHDSIQLKDTPIVDASQDDLARKDINTQMVIYGTAGTGKTTTLAKRIAMKNDINNWSASDQKLLLNKDFISAIEDKKRSWVLFTPSKKMKQYLKAALDIEMITPNDQNIVEWNGYLHLLITEMREILHISYQVEESQLSEKQNCNDDVINSNNYKEFQMKYIQNLCLNLPAITHSMYFRNYINSFNMNLSWIIKSRYSGLNSSDFLVYYNEFLKHIYSIVDIYIEIKKKSEDEINKLVNEIKLNDSYRSILKNYFPQLAERVNKDISDRNSFVKSFIFEILDKSDTYKLSLEYPHKPLGIKLQYAKIYHQYINDYKIIFKFMSILLSDNYWYFLQFAKENPDNRLNSSTRQISKDLFLIYLANVLENNYVFFYEGYHTKYNVKLTSFMRNRFFSQVYIDEAEEFTPQEIAVMSYLAYPPISSICVSGDLLQNTKPGCVEQWAEIKNIQNLFDFGIYPLKTVYRNSDKILQVVNEISSLIDPSRVVYKSEYTTEGFPLLYYKYTNQLDHCDWIISRILEIKTSSTNTINKATIAILADSDDMIIEVYNYLRMNSNNLEFIPIFENDVINNNTILVTQLDYIKGIEFDCVFVIDVDSLYRGNVNFINYLYASITRATTYVGITYKTQFPKPLLAIFKHFELGNWKNKLR